VLSESVFEDQSLRGSRNRSMPQLATSASVHKPKRSPLPPTGGEESPGWFSRGAA
jgi:hypothetical protein